MTFVSERQPVDPAEQAAQLLFRIGFGILCVALPMAAVVSRRAVVVIAPIGTIVLIFATLMMKGRTQTRHRIYRMITSPVGLTALFMLAWSTLSLAWTPYPGAGTERLLRVIGSLGLALGAILALPERMRVSNLYLLSIGVGLATVFALAVAILRPSLSDPVVIERAAILIALLAWPAVTWLAMKQRSFPAMGIAGGVGALALVLQGPAVLPALLVGGVLLGGAVNNLRGAVVSFTIMVVILILGAPVIALVLSFLTQQGSAFGRTMQVWSDLITADPMRLLTGYGLETTLRNRLSQILDNAAPASILFEIWYELGVLGALAACGLMVFSVRPIANLEQPIGAFVLGCIGFAFTLAIMGLSTSQSWWITALATTAIAFMAVINGQYRTRRPAAWPSDQARGPQTPVE